jgi:hypothetical protein
MLESAKRARKIPFFIRICEPDPLWGAVPLAAILQTASPYVGIVLKHSRGCFASQTTDLSRFAMDFSFCLYEPSDS